MMRAAALMLALFGTSAAAQQFFEVDRFDLTGQMSTFFDPDGVQSDSGDGSTFQSTDGLAELQVFGAFDVFDGLAEAREITRKTLLFDGSTITYKYEGMGEYAYSGTRPNGHIYYRYTRLGQTCEGIPVYGSFVLSYDPVAAATYDPMTDHMIADLHIGACG